MRGSRPLTDSEVESVAGQLAPRDRALFVLGVCSGFRISEMLSLRVGDVEQSGRIVESIAVARKNMKGKTEGRIMPLAQRAGDAVAAWLEVLRAESGEIRPDAYLFGSRKGRGAMTRGQAWRVLKAAYAAAGLAGKLGTHAMRKTFAARIYKRLGHDLVKTQRAMGHKNISDTVKYLGFNIDGDVNAAVLAAGR